MSDLTTLKEWAEAMVAAHVLAGGPLRRGRSRPLLCLQHPAVLIQAALQETFRPTSPVEVYSDHRPDFAPQTAEQEEWIPIDILLGCYEPSSREIKIFIRNIIHFADTVFKRNPSDVEFIVRLHEYAHAILHLGVFWEEEDELIRQYPPDKETDWQAFLEGRTAAFYNVPEEVNEWVAQLLVWITLDAVGPEERREELQEVFLTIMEKQPPHYKLCDEVLKRAAQGDCTVLLSWLRNPAGAGLLPSDADALTAAQTLLMVTYHD